MTAFVVFGAFLLAIIVPFTDAAAVMSVDLGTEWMKIAIVSPGVPMEVVLNKESKRKTPVAISFRDSEREFGEDAVGMSTRFPDKVFRFMIDLLGKNVSDPVVKMYKDRFSYYSIVGDEARKTVVFNHDKNVQFTAEELVAMILEKAKEQALQFSQQAIRDAVITVPAFFNQAERKAVKIAAEMAGLKVLQLMSDNAAVALNYGIFRRKDFNTTPQNIMFYDMGAGSTTATIVGYQMVKTKEKGYVESHPQLTILGVGFDRTLGGLEMTLRLRDYLAKKFAEQKLTNTDIFTNQRAMAKLLKEAERVKMVLSANADHVAQVEGLLDDKDFKCQVTRVEFERLCDDLFQRAGVPIQLALKAAAMTAVSTIIKADIDQVILAGAGTRVPKVQDVIMEVSKKPELGKNLNTDEAAALGAVYQAAYLGQGFKVKRFIVKEAVLSPILVSFERQQESDDGIEVKTVTRTLFSYLNPYPQKKVMTFNRLAKDFDLVVSYGEPHAGSRDFVANFTKVSLTGVAEALNKHQDSNSEHKGIKAHFRMDESGLLTVDHVECVFEKIVPIVHVEEESAFSKLGSTISKLFSGSSEPEVEKEDDTGSLPSSVDENATDNTTEDNVNGDMQNLTENVFTTANTTTKESDAQKNGTVPSEKTKTEVIKENLKLTEERLDIPELSSDLIAASVKKLQTLNDREREKHAQEEAHNALESFVLETQGKLYQPEYEAVTSETQRETIQSKLKEVADWLDDEGYTGTAKVFKEKLTALKSATKGMYERERETRERPEAILALKEMLNVSSFFLAQALNISADEQYFTTVELDTLEKLITSTQDWLTEKMEEQAKTALSKPPVLTVRSLSEKIAALDREVKYLVNKARTAKPKKMQKNESEAENVTGEGTENTTEETEETLETKDSDSDDSTEIPIILTDSDNTSKPEVEEHSEL